MSSPLERSLIIVVLAGIAAVVVLLRGNGGLPTTTTTLTTPSATIQAAAPADYVIEEPVGPPTTVSRAPVSVGGSRASDLDPTGRPSSINSGSGTTGRPIMPESTRSTLTLADPSPAIPSPTTSAASRLTGQPTPMTSPLLSSLPAVSSVQPETPLSCAPVRELWEADGYPVEDPCTLAEVRRVFRWAWTGSDRQRRSAIRNSHLLDAVFLALDEYGRTQTAGLFDPETRGEWSVVFDDIRWRGGPRPDRAVVAVTHGFVHRDYPHSPRWTSTAVQVEGEWKLSYRRSYCLQADLILETTGSDVRCPPDPDPELNEHEDPDIVREHGR